MPIENFGYASYLISRYGHFTKISEDGCYIVGQWRNGLMEGVFDLEDVHGWKRACYKNGLKHGLQRCFSGSYAGVQALKRVAFYTNDR